MNFEKKNMLNRLFGNVFGDVFTCLAPVRRDEFDQQDVTETENQFRIKLRFNSDITKKDITLRVDGNILYIEELNKCGVSCCKREFLYQIMSRKKVLKPHLLMVAWKLWQRVHRIQSNQLLT